LKPLAAALRISFGSNATVLGKSGVARLCW
jgi:hypothetical protein